MFLITGSIMLLAILVGGVSLISLVFSFIMKKDKTSMFSGIIFGSSSVAFGICSMIVDIFHLA